MENKHKNVTNVTGNLTSNVELFSWEKCIDLTHL